MNYRDQIHTCEENWYKDVEIRFEGINQEEWSWVLEQTWFASKFDVDDGNAEREGEIIGSHIILVSFCPFCGTKFEPAGVVRAAT
jgi:hypothetical protein